MKTYSSFSELINGIKDVVLWRCRPLETTDEAANMAVKHMDWDFQDLVLCQIEARCLVAQKPR